MAKKIEGEFVLIPTLQRQLKEVTEEGARHWYESIIAFSVLSLLSMVALSRYQDSGATIKKLKSMEVFPLHKIPWISSASKKVSIINISPRLYCLMLHLKERKRKR